MINKPKHNLFLLEIVIVIFFFAVSSAVIVKMFSQAHMESVESRDLLKAVTIAQSAADCYRVTGDLGKTASLVGAVYDGDVSATARFDREWKLVPDGGRYVLSLVTVVENGRRYADIDVRDGERSLFGLKIT